MKTITESADVYIAMDGFLSQEKRKQTTLLIEPHTSLGITTTRQLKK